VEPIANDMPLGADSVQADGADPLPDDEAGGLRCDLVFHGVSPGTPMCTTPGNVAPAPGSLGAIGPGVAELLVPGSPG
jgi:hypothetical protein